MTDPEKESEKQQGISKEAWAAIATIAVAVISGIFTITNTIVTNTGSNKTSSSPSSSPSVPPSSGSTPVPTFPSPSPLRVSNAFLGKWSGVAKEPSGKSFRINLEIQRNCSLKEKCGYISVPDVPCYGEISLQQVSSDDYEFDVSNFDRRSNLKICTPGDGERFHLLPDGKLAYKATYSNAQGILEKVEN
ncbi:MAG: hypothetical protein V7K41_10290 [Nostoc sp.]|uniref:hypothetical protein n=1 Tax=Nostoc sp. TaxID=1180 RepID=UPI002FFB7901